MKKIFLILLVLFIALLSGCSSSNTVASKSTSAYSIVDARGKKITFETTPQRIACFNYSATDILSELIPLDRIVATDKWAREEDLSNCADKLKAIPICEDNVEQIMKFKPDLVILSGGRGNELGNILDSVGIKACVLQQPKTIHEIPNFIKLVGSVVNAKEQADKLSAKVVAYLNNSLAKQKINGVLLLHPNGGIGQKGSMADSICEACNIENIAAAYDFSQAYYLSKEQIVALNPKILVVLDWSFGGQHKSAEFRKEEILHDPAYQSVSAVRSGKVVIVPMKYFHCTSQYVIYNLEKLKALMQKTAF